MRKKILIPFSKNHSRLTVGGKKESCGEGTYRLLSHKHSTHFCPNFKLGEKVLILVFFAVPPKAGAGFGETTHKAAENLGGAERLPEAAREMGKDELKGDRNPKHPQLSLIPGELSASPSRDESGQ